MRTRMRLFYPVFGRIDEPSVRRLHVIIDCPFVFMPDIDCTSTPFQRDVFPDFFCDWVTGESTATSHLSRFPIDQLIRRGADVGVEGAQGFTDEEFLDRWRGYLEEHGASAQATSNFDALRDGSAAIVMTGQQPGLFGGPLYTFYKAATACALADRLTDSGVPAVPVFWNHSDDHDLSEIDRTYVLDRDNRAVEVSLGLDHQRTAEIRSLSLPERTTQALGQLKDALRDTEFRDTNLSLLKETRRDSPADWFSTLLHRLFADEGLLVFEPCLARPYWTEPILDHLNHWSEDLESIRRRGDRLADEGYDRPLDPSEGPNLFELNDGDRTPVRPGGDRSLDDWKERVRSHPEQFSPGAALRPVVQDDFFPICAYVAGPGEITYHAQLGGLFERLEVRRAPLFPRMSATIVERKVRKVIDKFDLSFKNLLSIGDRTDEVLSGSVPAELDRFFRERRAEIDEVLDHLKEKALSIDENLESPWEKTCENVHEALEQFRKKVESAHLQEKKVGRRQLKKLVGNLLPNGKLQERVLSPWHYLTLYSRAFAGRIKEQASRALDRSDRHHFLELT